MMSLLVDNATVSVPVLIAICGSAASIILALVGCMVRHFLRNMAATLMRIERRVSDVADNMERKYVSKEMCAAHRKGITLRIDDLQG